MQDTVRRKEKQLCLCMVFHIIYNLHYKRQAIKVYTGMVHLKLKKEIKIQKKKKEKQIHFSNTYITSRQSLGARLQLIRSDE